MAIPARPVAGALLDSAWGGLVHDAIVAFDIQAGAFTAVHTSQQTSPQVNVTFPRPFGAPPMMGLASTNFNYAVGLAAPATATGFGAASWRFSGAASGSIVHQWIAYGPRA